MTYSDGFTDGYKAKERELDKYRWHDLRKDPNDLPKESKQVLVIFDNGDVSAAFMTLHGRIGNRVIKSWTGYKNVPLEYPIAWCEINPFEVEE